MPLLRKVLFGIFLLVYLIICPLLVLYALGYIFKPGTGHGITKGGLIHLETLPAGATVHVGSKRFAEKTPTTVQGLLPGDYPIVVSMKGYRPWTRTVPVQAEKAAAFDSIVLLPNAWGQKLSREEFDDLIPIRSDHFLLVTKGPLMEDLFLYDLKKDTLSPVLEGDLSFRAARVIFCWLADKSDDALIHAQLGPWGEERYFWVTPSSQLSKIKDVTALFHEKPQFIDWDAHHPERLFSFRDRTLNRLNLDSNAIYPDFMKKVRGYGLAEKKLYMVDEDGGFFRTDLEGKNPERLEQDAAWAGSLLAEPDLFRIRALPKDRVLFLGRRGKLLLNLPPYVLAEEGIIGLESDPRTPQVLVWRNDALGVLDFGDTGEARLRWVVKKGKRISQAFWVYRGSHALFRDGNKVFFLELLPGESPQIHDCFEVKRGSSILYSERSGTVYYLEKGSGRLCTAALLPKSAL